MLFTPVDFRRYLQIFVSCAVTVLLLVVVCNVLIDPYKVTKVLDRLGFPFGRPLAFIYARVHKPLHVLTQDFNGVVLGNSQAEQGVDPRYPALHGKGVKLYNLSLSGMYPYEMVILSDYLTRNRKIDSLIAFLDIEQYGILAIAPDPSAYRQTLPPDWNERTAWHDFLRALFSMRMLLNSAETAAVVALKQRDFYEHRNDGLYNVPQNFDGLSQNDLNPDWDRQELSHVRTRYQVLVKHYQSIRKHGFDHSELRQLMRIARAHDVKLTFVYSPRHARQWEVMAIKGLQRLWEQWKAEIACAVAEEATAAAKPAFAVWDFSDYGAPSIEALSVPGSKKMYWWNDSVHFTTNYGNLILDRIFGLQDAQFRSIDDTGVRLGTSFSEHFEAIQRQRDRYLAQHRGLPDHLRSMSDGPLMHVPPEQQGWTPASCQDLPPLQK